MERGEREEVKEKLLIFINPSRSSVRVDGVGSASILEVSFQEIPATKEEDNQTELKVQTPLSPVHIIEYTNRRRYVH